MIRLKFNSALSDDCSVALLRFLFMGLFLLLTLSVACAGQVAPESARRVAQGQVRHHTAIFGNWNGAASPTMSDPEIISLEGGRSAYHFRIQPTGYVIVSAYDNLSPIPFYSTRSTFDIARADNPNALEAWILYRLNAKAAAAADSQIRKAASPGAAGPVSRSRRVGKAWTYFDRLSVGEADQTITRNLIGTAADEPGDIVEGAMVEPLLTTIWGQNGPYSIEMPDDGCTGGHTLSGCVATAWAQLLKYWQWPPQSLGGQGAHTYTWEGATVTTDLSVDFTDPEAYDWANMSGDLNVPDTTQAQKEAVSKLMYYMAVAAEMDFGCLESAEGSGSSLWADQVLDTFFRFKTLVNSNNRIDVSDYTSAQWLTIIKNELEADPPRPIIFSIGSQIGWHEVVIDGYQEDVADKVHVNLGWEGNHDAYFDITDDDDFNAGGFDWDVKGNQTMVIGIEPNNAPPVIQAEDIVADEGTEVTLSVTSQDPEGVGVSRYIWTQVSGRNVTIVDAQSPTPTIMTPNFGFIPQSEKDLVFEVKVYDANRAFSTDTCTVSVRRPASGNGGGSGRGCFLDLLRR